MDLDRLEVNIYVTSVVNVKLGWIELESREIVKFVLCDFVLKSPEVLPSKFL